MFRESDINGGNKFCPLSAHHSLLTESELTNQIIISLNSTCLTAWQDQYQSLFSDTFTRVLPVLNSTYIYEETTCHWPELWVLLILDYLL